METSVYRQLTTLIHCVSLILILTAQLTATMRNYTHKKQPIGYDDQLTFQGKDPGGIVLADFFGEHFGRRVYFHRVGLMSGGILWWGKCNEGMSGCLFGVFCGGIFLRKMCRVASWQCWSNTWQLEYRTSHLLILCGSVCLHNIHISHPIKSND